MVDSSNDGGASLALDCNCCPGGKGRGGGEIGGHG